MDPTRPDFTRLFLDAAPPLTLVPEKVAARILDKSPHTLRGWRTFYPPTSFNPPRPIRIKGRWFYSTQALVEFVGKHPQYLNRTLVAQPQL